MQDGTGAAWQIASDALCAAGQAPFWHAREERLYWIDPPLKRVWRLHLPSGRSERWDLPHPVTGLAPCRSGGLLLLLPDGLYHCGGWMDVPRLLTPLPGRAELQLWRGGRCDPWGRYWLLSHSLPGERAPSGTLYCLRARSEVQPALERVRYGVGDGLDLSCTPDGRSIAWCDGGHNEVVQAALSQPGQWPPELASPMPLARFARPKPSTEPGSAPAHPGRPRCGVFDQQGNYWVALSGSGRLLCLDANGQTLASIATPALRPSGLCFGGIDRCTLFLCTSRAGCSPEELARYPQSGAVFALRLPKPGMPAAPYWD